MSPKMRKSGKRSKRVKGGSRKLKRSYRKGKYTRRYGKTGSRNPLTDFSKNDPFPSRKRHVLTYSQTQQFTTTGGNTFGTEQVFNLNNLYDPDFSGTGHQPYGFDQITPLYLRYKVDAAKVSLTFTDPSADGIVVGALAQPPQVGTTLQGMSIDRAAETPLCAVKRINNSGKQVVTISAYLPIHKLCGLSKLQFAADTDLYTSGVGTGPALIPALRVAVASIRNNLTDTIFCTAKIRYYATFFERTNLAQS